MDSSSFLDLVKILDGFSFPCDDAEPGRVNDWSPFTILVAVVRRDTEIGNFGVSEFFDVNAPDDASKFNSVQLFHDYL